MANKFQWQYQTWFIDPDVEWRQAAAVDPGETTEAIMSQAARPEPSQFFKRSLSAAIMAGALFHVEPPRFPPKAELQTDSEYPSIVSVQARQQKKNQQPGPAFFNFDFEKAENPDVETNPEQLDKYWQPTSVPVRPKKHVRSGYQYFSGDPNPGTTVVAGGGGTISAAQIYIRHFLYQSRFDPVLFLEETSLDRWVQPLSQPYSYDPEYRYLPPSFTIETQFYQAPPEDEGVLDDKWYLPLPNQPPSRKKRAVDEGLRVGPVIPIIDVGQPDFEYTDINFPVKRLRKYPPYFPDAQLYEIPVVIDTNAEAARRVGEWAQPQSRHPGSKKFHRHHPQWVIDVLLLLDAGSGGTPGEAEWPAVSLGAARTDLRKKLGDSGLTSAPQIWSDAELNRYLQDGYDRLLLATHILWKREAYNDTASTATATLPASLLQMERVTWNDKRIQPFDADRLQHFDFNYETEEGDVFGYVMEYDGIRTWRKVRVPASTKTTAGYLEYFARGTALSSDDVTFEIPNRYVKYVCWYAAAEALEKEGPGRDLVLSEIYRQRWTDGVARILRRIKTVQRMRRSRLGSDSARVRRRPPLARLPWQFGEDS